MKKQTKLGKRLKKEWKNIIFNSIFAIIVMLIVILFHKNIILATSLELVMSFIGLAKWKSKLTLIIFIFGAIFGAISEGIVIYSSGAWYYALPNILSLIPLWLFLVWGNATALIFETSNEIKKLGVKDS